MQLKNEIRNLNQSEIEISQMMITRQNDLKELMEHKQELKARAVQSLALEYSVLLWPTVAEYHRLYDQ